MHFGKINVGNILVIQPIISGAAFGKFKLWNYKTFINSICCEEKHNSNIEYIKLLSYKFEYN